MTTLEAMRAVAVAARTYYAYDDQPGHNAGERMMARIRLTRAIIDGRNAGLGQGTVEELQEAVRRQVEAQR